MGNEITSSNTSLRMKPATTCVPAVTSNSMDSLFISQYFHKKCDKLRIVFVY